MSLGVWFREDIEHILLAADRATASVLAQAEESAADPVTIRAFRRGYRAALSTVALACGLAPATGKDRSDAGLALWGGYQ